jgi:hypothetical protein
VAIDHQVNHALHDVALIKIWVLFRVLLIQILQKRRIRQLVALLMVLVILRMHLVTVVRQMDELVHFRKRVFIRTGSQIAWLVEIKILVGVYESQHPNVKFATIKQQRTLNVLLNDDLVAFLNQHVAHEVFPGADDLDTAASILILRLHYPNILAQLARWQPAILKIVLFKSMEALSHLLQLWIIGEVLGRRRDEAERHRALVSVVGLLEHGVTLVVVSEAANEA